jgi:hypothetical protein
MRVLIKNFIYPSQQRGIVFIANRDRFLKQNSVTELKSRPKFACLCKIFKRFHYLALLRSLGRAVPVWEHSFVFKIRPQIFIYNYVIQYGAVGLGK